MKDVNEMLNRDTIIDRTEKIDDRATVIDKNNSKSYQTVLDDNTCSEETRNDDYVQLIGRVIHGNKGDYVIEKFLAVGGEAVLFVCTCVDKQFVAKIYDNRRIKMNEEKRKKFIDFLYEQESDYIVSLFDYGVISTFGFARNISFDIYPYLKNGNLLNKKIEMAYIRDVIIPDVNEALNLVHSKGISHRDIKPQNILVSDDEKHVMLHDFSIMSLVDADGGRATVNAERTYGYAAPEILSGMPHIKSDYYAFGITLLCLLCGEDVYAGMDDEDIRRCTYYNQIPCLNKKKFTGISDSTISLRERIEGLICGLTKTDVNERWGYNEIKQWSEGQLQYRYVQLETEHESFSKPFVWEGKGYYTLKSVAEVLAEDWVNALKPAGRGYIAECLRGQRADIASKLDDITESPRTDWLNRPSADAAFFRIIYTIAPELPVLYWRGKKYDDFNALATHLYGLKREDESFKMMLLNQNISWYMSAHTALDYSEITLESVKAIENHANISREEAYYMFIIQFLPVEKKWFFTAGRRNFEDVESLVEYIKTFNTNAGKWIKENVFLNPQVYAWMWFNGFQKVFFTAADSIKNATDENCLRRFLIMADKILMEQAKDTETVRQLVVKQYEHITWLKNNLDRYEYLTDEAKQLKAQINLVLLDTVLTVEELYKNLNGMQEIYNKFISYAYINPYRIEYGVIPNSKDINILPKDSSAAFVFSNYKLPLSAGFVASTGRICASNNFMQLQKEAAVYKEKQYMELKQSIHDGNSIEKETIKKYYKNNIWRILLWLLAIIIFGGLCVNLHNSEWRILIVIFALIASIFPIFNIAFEIYHIIEKKEVKKKFVELNHMDSEIEEWNEMANKRGDRLTVYYKNILCYEAVPLHLNTSTMLSLMLERAKTLLDTKITAPEQEFYKGRLSLMHISGFALSFFIFIIVCQMVSNYGSLNSVEMLVVVVGGMLLTVVSDIIACIKLLKKPTGLYFWGYLFTPLVGMLTGSLLCIFTVSAKLLCPIIIIGVIGLIVIVGIFGES